MHNLSDWHVHTCFSSDSECPMENMVQEAIKKGLSSICFTDHNDLAYPEYDESGNMLFQLNFKEYVDAVSDIKEKYKNKIEIYTGVEQGLEPKTCEITNQYDQLHQLDFIIGSSHLVDGQDPYYPSYWEDKSTNAVVKHYFDYIIKNLSCCTNFDVYGHLDYIIRYTPTKDAEYSWHQYQEQIECILKTLIGSGKGIEINTGGLKYGLKETNPAYGIIKYYHDLGGEIITIGSDAHKEEHLAYDFKFIPDILKSAGFDYYTIFKRRKPEFIHL